MKVEFDVGDKYWVGFVRDVNIPKQNLRTRARFTVEEQQQYKGMLILYGSTEHHTVGRVPELQKQPVAQSRSASCVIHPGQPIDALTAAVWKLKGGDGQLGAPIYIEREGQWRLITLSAGLCRGEDCTGPDKCGMYHGPHNMDDWTRDMHFKKSRWVIDQFLKFEALGQLTPRPKISPELWIPGQDRPQQPFIGRG